MLNLFDRARTAGRIPRGTPNDQPHLESVADDMALEIDTNGSPVSVPASEWFVCFVPGLQKQWWHRFTNARHQHVFVMRMVDDGHWILVEPWWTRMLVSVLTLDEAVKFLRWGAAGDILQVRERLPGRGSQVRGWSNCAVLTAFLLGRSYWTWTPHGLYRRLLVERDTRPIDVGQWLTNSIRIVATRIADQALKTLESDEGRSLRTTLLHLGDGIVSALTSRSGIALYKLAVCEPSRFGAAANAYWESARQRAIEAVAKALQRAQVRGEVKLGDPAVTARQFVAMLRGDIHFEIMFGLKGSPDSTEIYARVKSAVDVLLNGILAPTMRFEGIDSEQQDTSRAQHVRFRGALAARRLDIAPGLTSDNESGVASRTP